METVEQHQDQVWSCFSFLFLWEEMGIECQLPPYASSVEVLMNVPETLIERSLTKKCKNKSYNPAGRCM